MQFLKSGDAGLALNKAILSKGNPLADVFYGVDNSFLSRALAADIFEPYASPALAGIPADLKLDASNRLLPVDFGYVTLNYDKEYFADNGIPLPQTLRDLTDAGVQGPAGRGEPGHLVARPGLPAGHHRRVRRDRAATPTWTSGAICARTTCSWPTAGRTPTTASSAAAAARATARWW